jgi:hypothetical protein
MNIRNAALIALCSLFASHLASAEKRPGEVLLTCPEPKDIRWILEPVVSGGFKGPKVANNNNEFAAMLILKEGRQIASGGKLFFECRYNAGHQGGIYPLQVPWPAGECSLAGDKHEIVICNHSSTALLD